MTGSTLIPSTEFSKHTRGQSSPACWAPGTGFLEDNFSMDQGWGDRFGDDSSALHLPCTLLLLLLHQLYLRSSGTRSQRLGTPAQDECWHLVVGFPFIKKESFCILPEIYLLALISSFKIQWITIGYRELLLPLRVTRKFIKK